MAVLSSDPVATTAVAVETSKRRVRPRWMQSLDIYISATFLLVLCFCCFLLPLMMTLPEGVHGSVLNANLPIGTPGHLLGTDPLGNDIISRLLAGGRVSLEVAAATQAIGLLLGGLLGMLAGFKGGGADTVLMRVLDMMIAFPSLVLVLAIVDGLGPSKLHIIWALCFFTIPAFARLARTGTLRVREQPFITSARVSGVGTMRMILRHVVPNVWPQLFTFALLGAGIAILIEGGLSYLGYGIPPPGASWGNMIAEGQQVLAAKPRLVIVPSVALLITVIALNTLGDGLRARWAR
jgi:peptide/nickel transport system permease protein